MCRWTAYKGAPIYMSRVVTEPCRSLIHQSLRANECKTVINGDGFGIGWYGEKEEPGIYRDMGPAWGDENLTHLSRQIRSHMFFAHVRAATGTATSRSNCHPFQYGRYMFMHNGQIGGWQEVRRAIEALIPDELYQKRSGTTDSEALFLAALAFGLESNPVAAFEAVLTRALEITQAHGISEPIRFAAALADGENLYAFRWSSDERAPSLYFRQIATGLLIASEPLDEERASWQPVPADNVLVANSQSELVLRPFDIKTRLAA
jgi:predicted glutamine amidotransferase